MSSTSIAIHTPYVIDHASDLTQGSDDVLWSEYFDTNTVEYISSRLLEILDGREEIVVSL